MSSVDDRNIVLIMVICPTWRHTNIAALLMAMMSFAPGQAIAESFDGPVAGIVLEVIDGDTLKVEARIWPSQSLRVDVRLRGIDAPEMHARCAAEQTAANRAKSELARILDSGRIVMRNIGGAKYYGRVLADVTTERGEAVATKMFETGLVRRYGGGRRQGWCG